MVPPPLWHVERCKIPVGFDYTGQNDPNSCVWGARDSQSLPKMSIFGSKQTFSCFEWPSQKGSTHIWTRPIRGHTPHTIHYILRLSNMTSHNWSQPSWTGLTSVPVPKCEYISKSQHKSIYSPPRGEWVYDIGLRPKRGRRRSPTGFDGPELS